ncbi:1-aminocyclopropane-1-carboxylate deaminase [Zobellella denitrificans]|uniref:1-aminocyclopropane-1-carboxylate deaminase n=1 Tax=Zobellella denitrificans TaxID=347534 RepID=A0A231MVX4_9GAMM|nr:pyridoxal-phosphate dependent enzyme [Zobellella denitrificans]ATG75266.1 1-aminocyclopropane-1-carboxylate deaminase [Zobellella denitrificans]OXS14344.1 1-aminocyclopropane-1-carboxylate deaminase [Zobellella denitrificans]
MSDLHAWQRLYLGATSSPLQPLHHPLLRRHGIRLSIKRDDLLHPRLSGNKWRKLKYVLRQALTERATGLLSFGGAWSNHLHALAAAGRELGLPTVGIVRGEPASAANPTLSDAAAWGMALRFVSRQDYRRRQDPDWLATLAADYPGHYLIPEGGSTGLALPGVAELWRELPAADELILPVASGGTLAGLIEARPAGTRLTGYAVLKGAGWLAETIGDLCPAALADAGWRLRLEHHGGGYAKCPAEDRRRILELATALAVPLEPVYSGKAMLGLFRDIEAGCYPSGSSLIFLHTGGLQGARGGL